MRDDHLARRAASDPGEDTESPVCGIPDERRADIVIDAIQPERAVDWREKVEYFLCSWRMMSWNRSPATKGVDPIVSCRSPRETTGSDAT